MLCPRSTMAGCVTYNPKICGSHPTAWTKREKMLRKRMFNLQVVPWSLYHKTYHSRNLQFP